MPPKKQKILIVEDDSSFLFILKKEFSSAGFLIITAKDGKECLRTVRKERPVLIVSDILLPELDGVEMAKKIRQMNMNMPIIFLSNVTDSEYLDGIKKIGHCDYLIKSNVQISDIISKSKDKLGLK